MEYLRRVAQKCVGGRPAFPALQTLTVSHLPYYARPSAFEAPVSNSGVPSANTHYVPPALIACLKVRRELGYPVASLQVPLSKCRSADIQDRLEGLVYPDYF